VKIRTLTAALSLAAALAPGARAQTPASPQQPPAPATGSVPTPAVPATGLVPAPPVSRLRIDINIPENRLRLYDGDSLLKVYRVSVGMPGHDTPDGQYTIDHAEWNPWWRPPPGRAWARDEHVTPPGPGNPMGRVKLFFAPLYYIHGSPNVRQMGTPASHGCIRMMNPDVIELARTIHERNGGSVGQEEIARLVAHSSQTRWSRIATPVPLTIRYEPIVVRDGELHIFRDFYDRGRVHAEGVVQALLAAGYDGASIDRAAVRQVLARAAASRTTYTVKLTEAFAGLRAVTETVAAGR
jgi:lipoprotein-anchoring transpeptidase ErfK/SrfK